MSHYRCRDIQERAERRYTAGSVSATSSCVSSTSQHHAPVVKPLLVLLSVTPRQHGGPVGLHCHELRTTASHFQSLTLQLVQQPSSRYKPDTRSSWTSAHSGDHVWCRPPAGSPERQRHCTRSRPTFVCVYHHARACFRAQQQRQCHSPSELGQSAHDPL